MIRAIDKEGLIHIGLRIKQLRKEKEMSQEQLAYTANISLSQISKLESGKHNTSVSSILGVCRAFNITISEFFEGMNYPVPVKLKAKKK
jgi:transcriptional regulator with XRE-family HTH domain